MDYQPSTIFRNPGHYKINHLGYRNYFGYISNFEAASGDPILYDPNLKKNLHVSITALCPPSLMQ